MLKFSLFFIVLLVARGVVSLDTAIVDDGTSEFAVLTDNTETPCASIHIESPCDPPLFDTPSTHLSFKHQCRGGSECAFSPSHVYCQYLPGTESCCSTEGFQRSVDGGATWESSRASCVRTSLNESAEFNNRALWQCSTTTHHTVHVHHLAMHCDGPVGNTNDMAKTCTVTYSLSTHHFSMFPALRTWIAMACILSVTILLAGPWALLPTSLGGFVMFYIIINMSPFVENAIVRARF